MRLQPIVQNLPNPHLHTLVQKTERGLKVCGQGRFSYYSYFFLTFLGSFLPFVGLTHSASAFFFPPNLSGLDIMNPICALLFAGIILLLCPISFNLKLKNG